MKSSSYRVVMITAMVLCVVVVGYYMATSSGVGASPVIAQVGPDTPAGPSVGEPTTAPSGHSTTPGSANGGPGFSGPVTTGPSSRPAPSDSPTGVGNASTDNSGRGNVPRPAWEEPPRPTDSSATHDAGASSAPRTHTVKAGETFQSIAKQYLGSENKWKEIAEANPKVDPTRLKIGQVLRVPEPKGAARTATTDHASSTTTDHSAAAPAERPAGSAKAHKIKQGDTLSSISKQYYGTTAHWKLIYNANKAKIGDDPDQLPDGIEITIPPAPAKKSN